jgi:hypothetical protein
MMTKEIPAVVLAYNAHLVADDLVSDLLNDYVGLGSGPATTHVEKSSPAWMGLEWAIPTALCIWFIKPYSDGLLKEMAKDHYAFLKQHVPKLYRRFLAPDRSLRVHVVATPGKVAEVPTFAREFSFEAKVGEKQKVRLLFKDDCTLEDARKGTELFCALVDDLADNSVTSPLIRALRDETRRSGWSKLVYFDSVRNELRLIDVVRSAQEKALVHVPLD